MLKHKERFEEGKAYATESTHILNRLRSVRDQLNSMYSLGYDTRRDMANLLYLLEINMVEIDRDDIK